jgi:hypothetical protein
MKVFPSKRRLLISVSALLVCVIGVGIWDFWNSAETRREKNRNKVPTIGPDTFIAHTDLQMGEANIKSDGEPKLTQNQLVLKWLDELETRDQGDENLQQQSQDTGQRGSSEDEDAEERYYSQFDEHFNQQDVPLNMVGIPRFQPSDSLVYNPTEADRYRKEQIETEWVPLIEQGILSHERRNGYVRIDIEGEDETVYIHPDYESRYRDAAAELRAINERGMVPSTDGVSFMLQPSKGRTFPDGTRLVYYRRKDGSLIRSVEKPDGTVRRWVIGWTDLAPYYAEYGKAVSNAWRDE